MGPDGFRVDLFGFQGRTKLGLVGPKSDPICTSFHPKRDLGLGPIQYQLT